MRDVFEPDSMFDELVEAFEDPNHPGWSVGSAEGGWVTLSEEDWDKFANEDAPVEQPLGAE